MSDLPEEILELGRAKFWSRGDGCWRSCETFAFYGEQGTAFPADKPVFVRSGKDLEKYWAAYPDSIHADEAKFTRVRVGGRMVTAVRGSVLLLRSVSEDDVNSMLVAERVEKAR